MAKAKHWSKMTDDEVLAQRDIDWPKGPHADPIASYVCSKMRTKSADEYRTILKNREQAGG